MYYLQDYDLVVDNENKIDIDKYCKINRVVDSEDTLFYWNLFTRKLKCDIINNKIKFKGEKIWNM